MVVQGTKTYTQSNMVVREKLKDFNEIFPPKNSSFQLIFK